MLIGLYDAGWCRDRSGVAKAVGQPLTERTMFTAVGARRHAGAYGPEQAEQNLTSRADVYAWARPPVRGHRQPAVHGFRQLRARRSPVLRIIREVGRRSRALTVGVGRHGNASRLRLEPAVDAGGCSGDPTGS